MTLDEARANIGAGVVYTARGQERPEDGVITSVGPALVFVRYASQHPGANGQATNPANLELLTPNA